MELDQKKLRIAILSLGCCLGEVSERASVSRSTVGRFLKNGGKVRFDTLSKLAKALQVEPLDLCK